jgi:hypothetical protein
MFPFVARRFHAMAKGRAAVAVLYQFRDKNR